VYRFTEWNGYGGLGHGSPQLIPGLTDHLRRRMQNEISFIDTVAHPSKQLLNAIVWLNVGKSFLLRDSISTAKQPFNLQITDE
jgi:hypothetical protein